MTEMVLQTALHTEPTEHLGDAKGDLAAQAARRRMRSA
jgi:hypothetical protein